MQQFTADAAHEFRTPLAATQSTVESALLLNSLPEPETRELLQVVKRQITRLSQIVEDLLLLARLERQEALQRLPCCLNDLISDLTFPVKSEQAASLHRELAISTNHAKGGDAPSNHPSELQLSVPRQQSRLWGV